MEQIKTVLWKKVDNSSLEHFKLYSGDGGFVLEGSINLVLEHLPTKVTYRVECDKQWRTRHVALSQDLAGKKRRLAFLVDKNQHWQQNKKPLIFGEGLFDIDFEISPATNLLPIRRLNLTIGESAESTAVWVHFPNLTLESLRQRYTRLSDRCYRYEAPEVDFKAQLEVDEAGLIVKYGALWMRIA